MMSALKGTCRGTFYSKSAFLKLRKFQPSVYDVKLKVLDHELVAVNVARAGGLSLDLQLDAVGGVHHPRAAAVHRLVSHGVQVDQQPELLASV